MYGKKNQAYSTLPQYVGLPIFDNTILCYLFHFIIYLFITIILSYKQPKNELKRFILI